MKVVILLTNLMLLCSSVWADGGRPTFSGTLQGADLNPSTSNDPTGSMPDLDPIDIPVVTPGVIGTSNNLNVNSNFECVVDSQYTGDYKSSQGSSPCALYEKIQRRRNLASGAFASSGGTVFGGTNETRGGTGSLGGGAMGTDDPRNNTNQDSNTGG